MIVIGLTGRIGVGKSLVADHLVAEHGFTKLSFAAPLKKMLRTLDPLLGWEEQGRELSPLEVRLSDFSEVPESEIKISPYGPEYRRLLQTLGTDCIRAVDEDFWVRAALKQLTDLQGRYVFDDVRFPNEAAAIEGLTDPLHLGSKHWRDHTSSLWHVTRPGVSTAPQHVSEEHAGRMGEEATLENDGTVEQLRAVVDGTLKMLGVKP